MKILLFMGGLIAILSLSFCSTHKTNQVSDTAADPRVKHFRLDKKNIAIDGYDPVSYFKKGPQKGVTNRYYDYNNIRYLFASDENLNEFKANPTKFEPVWGGWCGHAMAIRGEKVEINPECYKIIDGRNVLFFRTALANALTNWEKELQKTPEKTLMKNGDQFWNEIIKK